MINPLAGFESFATRSIRGRDSVIGGNDAATAGGMAFLVSQLEKQDPRLLEPLTSYFWFRDVAQRVGGGYVDFTSNYFPNYADADTTGIIASQTSKVPVIQADLGKIQFRVFQWGSTLRLPFIDMQKLKNTPFSLQELLDKGLRLKYNKALDQIVYKGVGNIPGLVNNTIITKSTAANPWVGVTPATADQIRQQIDDLIDACWAASNFDVNGIPNRVLVPPAKFSVLNQAYVIGGAGGNVSLREYILANNAATAQGVPLTILPLPYLTGAGVGGTDRMVAYRMDGDKPSVEQDLPVPITRGLSQVSLTEGQAYLTAYDAMIGQTKFLYPESMQYVDGI